jgi:peroxiredoxin
LKKKQFIGLAATITVLSLAWILVTPILFAEAQTEDPLSAPHPGFFAPPFTLETPQGDLHTLGDYRGRPVLVFFWASWCSICKRVMPGLEAVYQDYAPLGFDILAINTTHQDTLDSAMNTFQSQGYSFTMLLDWEGTVADDYRMHAVPTSVLIGPDGKITDVIIGSGISEGFLRTRLSSLFSEGAQ